MPRASRRRQSSRQPHEHRFCIEVVSEQIPYGRLDGEPVYSHHAEARCVCGLVLDEYTIANVLDKHLGETY